MLAGSVTQAERDGVVRELLAAGFADMSEGVRTICFAFQHSIEVRQAIKRFLESLGPATA